MGGAFSAMEHLCDSLPELDGPGGHAALVARVQCCVLRACVLLQWRSEFGPYSHGYYAREAAQWLEQHPTVVGSLAVPVCLALATAARASTQFRLAIAFATRGLEIAERGDSAAWRHGCRISLAQSLVGLAETCLQQTKSAGNEGQQRVCGFRMMDDEDRTTPDMLAQRALLEAAAWLADVPSNGTAVEELVVERVAREEEARVCAWLHGVTGNEKWNARAERAAERWQLLEPQVA